MEITSELLKEKIKNGEKLMVDFYGTFCGPCKVMKPLYEKASEIVKEGGLPISLYTFNIEDDMDYMRELGIRGVPTIKGFSGGKEVFSEVGLKQTNAILEMADKLS